jgi:hypothetical protein
MEAPKDGHCPYCNNLIEPVPKGKKKCPHCAQSVYVLGVPYGARVLATERQAIGIRSAKAAAEAIEQHMIRNVDSKAILRGVNIAEDPEGYARAAWQILTEGKKNTNDLHSLKMLAFHQARMLWSHGRNPYDYLKESHRFELMGLNETLGETGKVEILAGNCCGPCETNNGKTLQLSNALANSPIPNLNCTREKEGNGYGWCLCNYIASFSDILES